MGEGGQVDTERRYRAFFSYARADSKLAAKLHRALDHYRVPKSLRGMTGHRGEIPDSLHPIFRDREDLAGGGELGARLRNALYSSDALIVLCTPNSARSHWVDQEIRLFREHAGNDSIFPVIGAGDPGSDDPEEQCMPPSLRDNSVLAADLRDIRADTGHIIGDGPTGGRQKLIAGLLGVDLDQLRRREDVRRRRQMAAMGVAAALFLGLAVLSGVLGFAAQTNAAEAERQRIAAESNAERARKGEALASERAEAEALARQAEAAQRSIAEAQRKRAEQQTALALANAAEAERQAGIARSNAARAEAESVRARRALAEALNQTGLLAADRGQKDRALKLALAGWGTAPDSEPQQRVLLARLTAAPRPGPVIEVGSSQISFLAMSPDGSRIMTSGLDEIARLYDTRSGEQIALSDGASKGTVGAAAKGLVGSRRGRTGATRGINADPSVGGTKLTNNWFSPDSRNFLISRRDGTVEIRDAVHGDMLGVLRADDGPVIVASFHPDGKRLLTAGLSGEVATWMLGDSGFERERGFSVRDLRSAAWAADGRSIATMSLRSGLELWRNGEVVARLENSDANAGALAITADSRSAIQIDRNGTVRLAQLADGALEATLESSGISPGAFAISSDSRFVALGRGDGGVVILDIASRQPLTSFAAHDSPITMVGLSPDNDLLATAGEDGLVKLWHLAALFQDFRQLARLACTSGPFAGGARFDADDRAANPLIDQVASEADLCSPFR